MLTTRKLFLYLNEVVNLSEVAWPSGLRRQLKALVRKGVGSNPTAVIIVACYKLAKVQLPTRKNNQHRHCVRVVKELDSKSNGLCPHGFKSHRCRVLISAEVQNADISRPCALGKCLV